MWVEYLVYYISFDDKMKYAFVKGKSENECWRTACDLYGEHNIYAFTFWN